MKAAKALFGQFSPCLHSFVHYGSVFQQSVKNVSPGLKLPGQRTSKD